MWYALLLLVKVFLSWKAGFECDLYRGDLNTYGTAIYVFASFFYVNQCLFVLLLLIYVYAFTIILWLITIECLRVVIFIHMYVNDI